MTTPDAPARNARADLVEKAQWPRLISAIAPASTPRPSGLVAAFGSRPVAQSRESTGRPFVPVSEATSTRDRSDVPQPDGTLPVAWNGICCRLAGAPGSRTLSAGAKTWVFEVAATVIASGAVPGEPAVPKPKSSRSFPAEITGTTPALAT